MVPDTTARLRFREMTADDIDLMTVLLGDPAVMAFYPAAKSRDEVMRWIERNQQNYVEHGHGLWIIETHEGEFVGACLTGMSCRLRALESAGHGGRIAGSRASAGVAGRRVQRRRDEYRERRAGLSFSRWHLDPLRSA